MGDLEGALDGVYFTSIQHFTEANDGVVLSVANLPFQMLRINVTTFTPAVAGDYVTVSLLCA